MARNMTPGEVRDFLVSGTRTGNLATVGPDGAPHVAPIWFVLDGDDVVFTTGDTSVKARNLRNDPRVAIAVDEERPPFSFVLLRGSAEWSEHSPAPGLLEWATRIGGRYMGADRAEEFGRRNAVPGELLVRVHVDKVVARRNISD